SRRAGRQPRFLATSLHRCPATRNRHRDCISNSYGVQFDQRSHESRNVNERRSDMSVRTYALVSSIIFLLVAVLHLLRVVLQWNAISGCGTSPMWASLVAIVVAGFLSFAGFRLFQPQRFSLFR